MSGKGALEIRPATVADLDDARELARRHAWYDRRFYRKYGYDFGADHLPLCVERFLRGKEPVAFAAHRGVTPVGFAALAPLAWESEHFGLPMAQVPYLLSEGDAGARAAAQDALLRACEVEGRARGLRHVSLRVDLEDRVGLVAASECGYRVMDTIVTYLGRDGRTRDPGRASDPTFEGDTLRKEDLARVAAEELAPFEDFMRTGYRIDRFHTDPHLPPDRADELYVEWFHKVFTGEWADGAQIVRRDGALVGFCSFQVAWQLRERYGLRSIGRGLAGVLPTGQGGYSVLTERIYSNCPYGSEFIEFDTQIQNFPTINVWIKHGMPFVRGHHTLHLWLGA